MMTNILIFLVNLLYILYFNTKRIIELCDINITLISKIS